MTKPKPTPFPAVNAIQASLRTAREPALRARLETTLEKLRSLYGLPIEPSSERDLDMRRRESFAKRSHRYSPLRDR